MVAIRARVVVVCLFAVSVGGGSMRWACRLHNPSGSRGDANCLFAAVVVFGAAAAAASRRYAIETKHTRRRACAHYYITTMWCQLFRLNQVAQQANMIVVVPLWVFSMKYGGLLGEAARERKPARIVHVVRTAHDARTTKLLLLLLLL